MGKVKNIKREREGNTAVSTFAIHYKYSNTKM